MKSSDLYLFEAEFEVGAGKKLLKLTYEKIFACDASSAEFLLRAKYSAFRVTFRDGPSKVKAK